MEIIVSDNGSTDGSLELLQSEFPDYPPSLRETISVARCAINPLAEYSRLWDENWSVG